MNADALKSVVECPVCFRVPRGKILTCSNSHKICEVCYQKIVASAKQCPQGNCAYDQPPRRCRELETIVENADLVLNCRRESAGCREELRRVDMIKHENICQFREVPCPNSSCEQMIIFRSIDSHITESHPSISKLTSPELRPLLKQNYKEREWNDWILYEWKNELGNVFYPQIVKISGLWYFWIKVKADSTAAKQYEVTFEANNQDSGFKMMSVGHVHPIDMSVDEVMKTGDYLIMNQYNIDLLKYDCSQESQNRGCIGKLKLKFTVININY